MRGNLMGYHDDRRSKRSLTQFLVMKHQRCQECDPALHRARENCATRHQRDPKGIRVCRYTSQAVISGFTKRRERKRLTRIPRRVFHLPTTGYGFKCEYLGGAVSNFVRLPWVVVEEGKEEEEE